MFSSNSWAGDPADTDKFVLNLQEDNMQTAYVKYSFLWLLNSLAIPFEGEVVNQDLDETVLLQQISCSPKLIKITVH